MIHFINFEIIMAFFICYGDNNNTIDDFYYLQCYTDFKMINNNHYTISNNINNDSNNNHNDNHNKNKCGIHDICKIKPNGHNVDDIKLVQLITQLLVLIIVNVIIIRIFVNITFKISIYAVASLAVELFKSTSFELILSNICLWLMFDFNKQPLYFDYVVLMAQMIIAHYDYVQG